MLREKVKRFTDVCGLDGIMRIATKTSVSPNW